MIDLRSDTVTRPTPAMRAAIASAEVGDDVYGDDPGVQDLQATIAERIGKPAALFVASGTQSNLLAILSHCERGDEYICGQAAHAYRFEGGGAAVLGSVQPQPLPMAADGTIALPELAAAIKPVDPHFAQTRLVCLENTHSGAVNPAGYAAEVGALCKQRQLALHLDGARLFNAAIATGTDAAELAAPFDSVSICLSKGLGAPVGSVLLGEQAFIGRAHRWRKVLGGGMRQAGLLAAAGSHALAHHVERLADDHANAKHIAECLNRLSSGCATAKTNMVFLDLPQKAIEQLKTALAEQQIIIRGPRWVFHLDIDDAAVQKLEAALPTAFGVLTAA
ncbi:MAG: low-specificity L-threonine aldolase [Pseudomonadales bacterium]